MCVQYRGPCLRGVSRGIRRFSQAVTLRVRQCLLALWHWAQHQPPGTRVRHPQDARLAIGSIARRGDLQGATSATSQQGCRAALGGGRAHGGVGSGPSPLLPPGATAGSRDSRTPPHPPSQGETCGRRRQESSEPMEVGPVPGNTPREDNPPRSERARAGLGGGERQSNSDTSLVRGSSGAAALLGSSTGAATATGEGDGP